MWWLEVELYNDVKIFNNSFLCVVFRSVSHNLLMICRNFGCRCMLYSLILECTAHRCIIIIIITKTMFMAVIMAEPLREFTRSFDECRTVPGGRRPKTKPDDLGCESACTGCQNLHPPSPFIITQPEIINMYWSQQWTLRDTTPYRYPIREYALYVLFVLFYIKH